MYVAGKVPNQVNLQALIDLTGRRTFLILCFSVCTLFDSSLARSPTSFACSGVSDPGVDEMPESLPLSSADRVRRRRDIMKMEGIWTIV